MASPSTIDHGAPFDEIDEDLAHTDIFLHASPLTLALAPPIAALRAEAPLVRAKQSEHQDAVHEHEVKAVFIDDDCNGLVDETKVLVLAEVKGTTRSLSGKSPTNS